MRGERDMHRSKRFITNNTPQGLQMVDVMGHHRETHMHMALHTAADTAMAMVMMVMVEATVSATPGVAPCLC